MSSLVLFYVVNPQCNIFHRKFFSKFLALPGPFKGTQSFGFGEHLSKIASSSDLAHQSLHAKFQAIWTIQLAMGRVRFLPQHLVICIAQIKDVFTCFFLFTLLVCFASGSIYFLQRKPYLQESDIYSG